MAEEGGVRCKGRWVVDGGGARGSCERERRGAGISSDEGVERRDCRSGGGGDEEASSFPVVRVTLVVPLVVGASLARPAHQLAPMQDHQGW